MSENVTAPESTPQSAPATPSAPAAPAAYQPVHAVPTAATPQVAPAVAPATPSAPVEPSWLKGRLEETRQSALRQAQDAFARREAEHLQRYNQVQSQLHALVGVAPRANPEVDAVRQQFSELYPGLSRMEERAAQVEALLERAQDIDNQQNHYWQSYGRQSMNRLFEKAQESYGQPLNETARRQLHSAFTGYVSSSPELTARYASDPTLIDEFWDNFTSSFVNPARRSIGAAAETRTQAPLPSNQPGGGFAPPQQARQPENMDQRAAQGWAAYQHAIQNK